MNHNEARGYIKKAAGSFDGIVNMFSAPGEIKYKEAKLLYEYTRKRCRFIKIVVFTVCIVIIIMHIGGI